MQAVMPEKRVLLFGSLDQLLCLRTPSQVKHTGDSISGTHIPAFSFKRVQPKGVDRSGVLTGISHGKAASLFGRTHLDMALSSDSKRKFRAESLGSRHPA